MSGGEVRGLVMSSAPPTPCPRLPPSGWRGGGVGEATGEDVQGVENSLRIPEVGGEGPIPKPLIPGTSPGCRGRVRPNGAPATVGRLGSRGSSPPGG